MDPGLDLPEGLTARPPTRDDVPAITALVATCELDVDGMAEIDTTDVDSCFARSGFDPSTDMAVVHDGRMLVAWAERWSRRAEADVHPTYQGRGIGAALLGWTERRARAAGQPEVGQTVSDANVRAAELFRGNGYEPAHTSWILQIRFGDAPVPEPAVPEGVTFRAYEASDAQAVHRVIDDAFNEWEGREPFPFEGWAPFVIHHGAFAPELSPLAFDGDELVGAALSFDYPNADEGWIHQLATKASHRHRGIARALLQHAFRDFAARGKPACGLSTDSRTGALGLYERVGMRVRRSYTRFTKTL